MRLDTTEGDGVAARLLQRTAAGERGGKREVRVGEQFGSRKRVRRNFGRRERPVVHAHFEIIGGESGIPRVRESERKHLVGNLGEGVGSHARGGDKDAIPVIAHLGGRRVPNEDVMIDLTRGRRNRRRHRDSKGRRVQVSGSRARPDGSHGKDVA